MYTLDVLMLKFAEKSSALFKSSGKGVVLQKAHHLLHLHNGPHTKRQSAFILLNSCGVKDGVLERGWMAEAECTSPFYYGKILAQNQ
jgi:hypothetical protein